MACLEAFVFRQAAVIAAQCQHTAHPLIMALCLRSAWRASTRVSLSVAVQCIVLDDPKTGGRKVAGTHWDFNSYGGELKKAMGIAPQARALVILRLVHDACLTLSRLATMLACQ